MRRENVASNGAGSKAQRDRVRREMREQGCTTEQIVNELARQWGFRPRQAWRHAHGWTQAEVAERYNQRIDDSQASMTEKRISDLEAWPRGGLKPTLPTLAVLADIFATETWTLIDHLDREKLSKKEQIAVRMPIANAGPINTVESKPSTTARLTYATVNTPTWALSNQLYHVSEDPISNAVACVAIQSLAHAENAQVQIMPDATLEELTEEVERLAKELVYASPLSVFPHLVRVRDQIYRLLERRQYPRQTTQLYYLASITCFLLAHLSHSLGSPRAGLELTRASWTYAEIIGHNILRARSRVLQAGIVHSEGRHQAAYDLVVSAAPWITDPLTSLAFNGTRAYYSTVIGNTDNVATLLREAVEGYDPSTDDSDLSTRVAGVFKRKRAKLLQDAADTYLELGDFQNAEAVAAEALQLYETGPADERATGSESRARIALAYTRLAGDDADGARDALRPVLSLPSQNRTESVANRLREFSSTLRLHRSGTSTAGLEIRDKVEEFIEAATANGFPTLG